MATDDPIVSALGTEIITPLPAKTPLPLSAGQEQQVRDIYYRRVRSRCADEIKTFAACALGRTFTATFVCREQRLAMNNCMMKYATRDEQDRAREEWFATLGDRRRAKEEKEKKRKAQEEFHKEWWGLDEQGRMGGRDKARKEQDGAS